MYVSFSPLKLVEYQDARLFQERVGHWMAIREAENCYLLGNLPWLVTKAAANGGRIKDRFFAVQEGGTVVGAAILFESGNLCVTWLSLEMMEVLVTGLLQATCVAESVFGPGYVSWKIAERWAQMAECRFAKGRAERLYELTHLAYTLPENGRLEPATADDLAVVKKWMKSFLEETESSERSRTPEELAEVLVGEKQIFLWKRPEAVAMAGWTMPTTHGVAINYVYVPAEFRGHGHGKTVTAALGQYLLSHGRRFVFILTEISDRRSNQVYQSIGARTLGEFMHCDILATAAPRQSGAKPERMNELGVPRDSSARK